MFTQGVEKEGSTSFKGLLVITERKVVFFFFFFMQVRIFIQINLEHGVEERVLFLFE